MNAHIIEGFTETGFHESLHVAMQRLSGFESGQDLMGVEWIWRRNGRGDESPGLSRLCRDVGFVFEWIVRLTDASLALQFAGSKEREQRAVAHSIKRAAAIGHDGAFRRSRLPRRRSTIGSFCMLRSGPLACLLHSVFGNDNGLSRLLILRRFVPDLINHQHGQRTPC